MLARLGGGGQISGEIYAYICICIDTNTFTARKDGIRGSSFDVFLFIFCSYIYIFMCIDTYLYINRLYTNLIHLSL
jgi:hypothetical protein